MVGMGSIVTRRIPAYGLAFGSPSRLHGYVCACGHPVVSLWLTSSEPDAAVFVYLSEVEKLAVSLALASTWTLKMQVPSFPKTETANNARIRLAKMDFMTD